MFSHPLFVTLKNLRGNARAVVFTEPLWGIPYNLYIPYLSIYMIALGLSGSQIGLLVSLGSVSQLIASFISGAVTDRLGRRRTTLIFDFISWGIACLVWAVAQNFTYFLIAAIINGFWRVSMNAWSCLLVEDTDPDMLVEIYSWIYIGGLAAAFFAPLAGLLIHSFTLMPTMRGLLLFSFIMMTTKFLTLYHFSKETEQGLVRLAETRNQSFFSIFREYQGVVGQILKTPQTLFTLGIMLLASICAMINNTFWSVLVTERIHIPAGNIAIFPFIRSIVILIFFFIAMATMRRINPRKVMLAGFGGYILSQLVLIATPENQYVMLIASVVLEACSYAMLNPMLDRLMVVTVDPQERARIQAIIYVIVILGASPFGWIAGILSDMNQAFPYLLSMSLFALSGVLVYLSYRLEAREVRREVEGVGVG